MLTDDLNEGPLEGTLSTEPFVDDDPQGILVAGRSWFAPDLFGSHIGDGACHSLLLRPLRDGAVDDSGDAKVTEPDFVVFIQQHVLWLDVAMDQLAVMGIL